MRVKIIARLKRYAILTLIFFISGCATNNTLLSPNDKATIQVVSIRPTVDIPAEISYNNNMEMGMMMWGGLIGYGIAHAMDNDQRARIQADMQQNAVDISRIVYQSFAEAVRQKTAFHLTARDFGEAQFVLKVQSYGFGTGGLMARTKAAIPTLTVTAMLFNRQGKIVWQNTQKGVLNDSPYNNYPLHYYLKNPAVMKQAFQIVANTISENLTDSLQAQN